MAKRTSTAVVRALPASRGSGPIIVTTSSPAPASRPRRARRVGTRQQKRRTHRKHSGGSFTGRTLMGVAIGGAVMGFIDKSFPQLPTLPIVGRTGTIALGAYMLSRQGGMAGGIMRDVAIAAAAVAGYELGKDGKVSGDVEGDLAPQVHGIAAQI